jgi:hypothetical protein
VVAGDLAPAADFAKKVQWFALLRGKPILVARRARTRFLTVETRDCSAAGERVPAAAVAAWHATNRRKTALFALWHTDTHGVMPVARGVHW